MSQQMISTQLAAEVSEQTTIGFYLVYAVIAVGLIVWLARTLYRNGAVFLSDVFDDAAIAGAVNHLLVIGFYLLNLGYALMLYRLDSYYPTLTLAFNELVTKLGTLLLSLGVIHLLNMAVFWRIRTYGDRKSQVTLPPPNTFMPPPPNTFMPPPPGSFRDVAAPA